MIDTPDIDYGALSPVIALVAGICVVLLVGLIGPRGKRRLSSALTLMTLAATAGLLIWQLGEPDVDLVAGALRSDGLAIIRAIKREPPLAEVRVMLVSNYPEYQKQAVADGAEPGFGKAGLREPVTLERLRKFLA